MTKDVHYLLQEKIHQHEVGVAVAGPYRDEC